MRKIILHQKIGKIDKNLFIISVLLVVIGVIAVFDSSFYVALNNFSDSYYFARQQLISGLIGISLMIFFSLLDYKYLGRFVVPMLTISIILLLLVLFPFFSSRIYGARRWLVFGPINFQPSEIVKLSLVLYFAKLSEKNKKLMPYLIILGVISFLIMLQPDLGTTMVVVLVGFSQIFMSGVGILKLFASSITAITVSFILILLSDYRRERLMTFLNATTDPLGKSYHIRQILIALGSGGLTGVGIGQSKQKLLFLPESSTDSIFAIIAEETGFIGAFLLIILFMMFTYFGMRIAKYAPDKFSQVAATGIVVWICGQAFINISSMLALVPLTGIPLPFISYGGSSLVTILVACGILLNISRHINYEKIKKH